jgi:hypothetical protein
MRDDQKFNIESVASVERYPVIYDHTSNGFSKKHVAEKDWMAIAGEVK